MADTSFKDYLSQIDAEKHQSIPVADFLKQYDRTSYVKRELFQIRPADEEGKFEVRKFKDPLVADVIDEKELKKYVKLEDGAPDAEGYEKYEKIEKQLEVIEYTGEEPITITTKNKKILVKPGYFLTLEVEDSAGKLKVYSPSKFNALDLTPL